MALYFSWREARILAGLGLPIILAQLSQMGMNFVDTVMAGRHGAADLAGVAVASSIWAPVTMFAVGCLMALPAMSSQMVGARRPDRAAHLLRQGMLLSLAMSALLIALLWAVSCRLDLFGLDAELEPIARGYLRALLPGLPAFLLFISLRSFMEGFGRTRPAMVIGLFCLVLNIPCNWIFIYGHFGMPELGGVGCGVATTICYWFMALGMFFHIHRDKEVGRWSVLRGLAVRAPEQSGGEGGKSGRQDGGAAGQGGPVDLALIGSVLRVGLPNAVAICVEVTLFALTALLLAPLGTVVVAGHQITMNYASIVFCLPLSINMSASIRVGRNLGAGSRQKARVSAHTALLCGVSIALLTMAMTILLREPICSLYTSDPDVLALACSLMVLCGCYQMVDSTQSIGAGILRGYNDTRIISLACLISYGVVGLAGGYALGRTDLIVPAMGAHGFWVGYIVALAVCACCFLARLHWLHGKDMDWLRRRLAK